jgi:hypothetical protein
VLPRQPQELGPRAGIRQRGLDIDQFLPRHLERQQRKAYQHLTGLKVAVTVLPQCKFSAFPKALP